MTLSISDLMANILKISDVWYPHPDTLMSVLLL